MERYWLNVILMNNDNINKQLIKTQFYNINLISSYLKDKKIINQILNNNKSDCACDSDCDINKLCITDDLEKLKKCNNFNKFLNNNPIIGLLFKKIKIDICYTPNLNTLDGEYKKNIINNIRIHMGLINKIHDYNKIILLISMYDCLIRNFHLVKNNSLFKTSLEKLYEIDKLLDNNNWLEIHNLNKDVIKKFINIYIEHL